MNTEMCFSILAALTASSRVYGSLHEKIKIQQMLDVSCSIGPDRGRQWSVTANVKDITIHGQQFKMRYTSEIHVLILLFSLTFE